MALIEVITVRERLLIRRVHDLKFVPAADARRDAVGDDDESFSE